MCFMGKCEGKNYFLDFIEESKQLRRCLSISLYCCLKFSLLFSIENIFR